MTSKIHYKTIQNKGFTLIELIVVIAIIGLLASVVVTALGVSRSRAEVAKMLTDYKSVSNALELYRQSHGGTYPEAGEGPMEIQDLIENDGPLSEYIKQSPSVSPAVAVGSRVLYDLNSRDSNDARLWCGNTSSNQDYVIHFVPTNAAIDSGLFDVVSYGVVGRSIIQYDESDALCIMVDQK